MHGSDWAVIDGAQALLIGGVFSLAGIEAENIFADRHFSVSLCFFSVCEGLGCTTQRSSERVPRGRVGGGGWTAWCRAGPGLLIARTSSTRLSLAPLRTRWRLLRGGMKIARSGPARTRKLRAGDATRCRLRRRGPAGAARGGEDPVVWHSSWWNDVEAGGGGRRLICISFRLSAAPCSCLRRRRAGFDS